MATTNYNQNAAGESGLDNSKEVGPNVTLEVPSGTEVPITNVSFSEEAETSEVQYNTGFNKDIAVTGVSYSGSFEITGNANNVRAAGWDEANAGATNLPRHIDTMVIEDSNRRHIFEDVLLNSHSKDMPSDDRTEQSFDFVAQKAYTVST